MTWWQAAFLGVIQGLTEFLPVSSSGHLAIFEKLFALQEATLTFDIMLHVGTLFAVIIFFRKQILSIRKELAVKVIIATIPIVLAGVFLKPVVESLRTNMGALVVTYAFTAALLFIADRILVNQETDKTWSFLEKIHSWLTGEKPPTYLQSFLVGIIQILAVLPGISRSGSTVSAGVIGGVSAQEAFAFAFLISIPAVGGAVLLDMIDVVQEGLFTSLPWGVYLLGAGVSGLVGWGALSILQWFITQKKLWPFALYCAFVSILLLFFV